MTSHPFEDLSHEEIEEQLAEYSIKICFNPRNQQWRHEAQHNHLHIAMHEGLWRDEYEQALADAIKYYDAVR